MNFNQLLHMKLLKITWIVVIAFAVLLTIIHFTQTTHLEDTNETINLDIEQDDLNSTEVEKEIPQPSEEIHAVSYWNLQGNGPALIKISLSKQVAHFYIGNKLAGVALVSTGRKGYETPVGHFEVTQKIKNHRSGNYGTFKKIGTGRVVQSHVNRQTTPVPPGCYYEGSPMFYYMNFAPEIGIHSGYLPGYPDSHGCVRVTQEMAQSFFENTEVGTPVIVEQ